MQIFNKQFLSIPAGRSMKMESSLYLHFDSLAPALSAGTDSHFMSSAGTLLQPHELLLSALWTSDLPPADLLNPRPWIDDAVSAEENISIAGLAVHNASDSISFFEDGNIDRNSDMYFSVAVPVNADCGLVINAERAAGFWITVAGMKFAVNNKPDFLNSRARYDLRKRLTGRMICLLKQQLNL